MTGIKTKKMTLPQVRKELISMDDHSVYQVRGIKSSMEEMRAYRPVPVMVDATMRPYHGVIITDGQIAIMNIFFGGGIKKEMKDIILRPREGIRSSSHSDYSTSDLGKGGWSTVGPDPIAV